MSPLSFSAPHPPFAQAHWRKGSGAETRRILALHHTRIRETLQIQSILAHLNELGLLTANERDVLLNPLYTESCKKDCLVQWLPQKGRNALHRFIVCLQRSSSDALGHEELARLLGRRGHTCVTVRPISNKTSRYASTVRTEAAEKLLM